MSCTKDFFSLIAQDLEAKPTEPSEAFNRALMAKLLSFTRFREQADDHPDPFDDPFVGAALFTCDYRLLGAYRKQKSGERHSEPEAIIQALRQSEDETTAPRIIEDINSAYREKIWLQSGRRAEFENLFQRAGDHLKSVNNTTDLIMFSSLEPCGLYEANPSCANILCACGVGQVLYASDDTNPKGRGRPVLLRNKVKVTPNLLPQEAVDLNNRFFATVGICNETYTDYSHRRLFSGAPWSTFSEDKNLFQIDFDKENRLLVSSAKPLQIQYVGPEHSIVSHFVTTEELDVLRSCPVEPQTTFFYGGNSIGELSKLLYRHVLIFDYLPGRIVSPDNPFEKIIASGFRFKELAEILRSKVHIHQNAFRKHHEIWRANRYLILAAFRTELLNHLSVLVKVATNETKPEASPYLFLFGEQQDLAQKLEKECLDLNEGGGYAARITILGNALAESRLSELLREINRRNRTSGLFLRTSFEVGLLALPGGENADQASKILTDKLQNLNHISVEGLNPKQLAMQHTAAQLNAEIRSGRRDQNFFSQEYIDGLSRSIDWTERKNAGAIIGRLASNSAHYAEKALLEPLKRIANSGFNERNWPEVCTRLNAIRDAAAVLEAHHSQLTEEVLKATADALEKCLERPRPWMDDVIWRWLNCWFELSDDVSGWLPPARLVQHINENPFLLSSAAQYALRSTQRHTRRAFDEFLNPTHMTVEAAKAASIAGARILARGKSVGVVDSYSLSLWLETLAKAGQSELVDDEFQRCRMAREAELMGLYSLVDAPPDLLIESFPPGAEDYLRSYVAMRALSGELGAMPQGDEAAPAVGFEKRWRDDHRHILLDVLSYFPRAWRAAALRALAADADVSLRWAVLYVTLNGELVSRLFGADTPTQCARVASFRAEIVDVARRAGAHYWLDREVLDAFLAAHQKPKEYEKNNYSLPFPSAARLSLRKYLFENTSSASHPELMSRVEALRNRSSRILLVLPPINWPISAGEPQLANEGSPPLGLGQIASVLSAHGHFVEVLDAHRYGYDLESVARRALSYDFVGISTVFSTMDSTEELASRISRYGGKTQRGPCIVVGGHAATLAPSKLLASRVSFDYIVEGPGETAIVAIIEAHRNGTNVEHENVITCSGNAPDLRGAGGRRRRQSDVYGKFWDSLPVVDRSVFLDPDGVGYEPALTRNGETREAHFVMSKGCDWTCKFCTEAILTGRGEVRRSAIGVLDEVRFVCEDEGVRRVQFIDDNLLPPLAAPGLNGEEKNARENWARQFLNGLQDIRQRFRNSSDNFGWRGLFRLEDMIAYQQRIPSLITDLAESGCTLLAFGVEHGDEKLRRELKGSTGGATNSEIRNLVTELRRAGIASKAYFILGGPHDDEMGVNKTIDFALWSGVDLAYFAIYKDFRGMAERASSNDLGHRIFEQFAFDLSTVANTDDEMAWIRNFGENLKHAKESYRRSLIDLKRLGFKFSSLFKYSDFHGDLDIGWRQFDKNELGTGREAYFRLLRRAYLEFYARDAWVEVYKNLIERGY